MIIEYKIRHNLYDKIILDTDKCTHCGYCSFACNDRVINWDNEKQLVVVTNPELCDSCNHCVCPFEVASFDPYNADSENYLAYVGSQDFSR